MRSHFMGMFSVTVLILSLSAIHSTLPVHATRLPTISINPSGQPLGPAGSTVTYGVNVSNIDPNNPVAGWVIYVDSNSSVLNPVSITLGQFLSGAIQQVLCIDDNAVIGNCSIDDGPGIVHSEVYTVGSGGSGNGTLFTITYNSVIGQTCTKCYSFVTLLRVPTFGALSPELFDLYGTPITGVMVVDGSYGNVPILPVASFSWTPIQPFTGDRVNFTATNSTTPPGTMLVSFDWTFYSPHGSLIIFSGVNISRVFGSADAGSWTVALAVRNNLGVTSRSTFHTVYVAPRLTVDLAISSFTASQVNNVLPGTIVTFKVNVQNAGTVPETGFNVSLSVPGNAYLARFNGYLYPGATQSFTFPWNTTGVQPGSYTIHARVPPLINETNTANNDAYLTLVVLPGSVGDFGIKANPALVTIPYGGVGSTAITLTSLDRFSGIVTLQAVTVGLTFPAPATLLTLSPGQVTIAPGSSANATLGFSSLGQPLPPGAYSVNVTGTSGSASHSIIVTFNILQPPPDFQLILSVPPGSNTVVAGSFTTVGVQLVSTSFPYFNGNVTLTGQVSPSVSNGPTLSFNPKQISLTYPGYPFSQLTVSTTTLTPPGNYTVTVTGTSGTLVHIAQFQLVVLPPPVLTLSPSSGPVGTQVTVHGSGFINPSQGPYYYPVEFQITFDDQLVGLFYLQGSSFNFTLDVPNAQAGIVHKIHAEELYPSSLDIQASFLVLPQTNTLTISVSTGTIYFPGDTATIFAMTNLAGQPTTVSQLQVILVTPNGSNITLNTVLVTPGVYKATYTVPTTAVIGTYAVIVKAHQAGSPDGSALASFEVKPTWLQSNGRNVLTATSLVGAVGALGVVAFAWRRGYFTRGKDEFLIP